MAKTREQIMKEIQEMDQKINHLVAQMPAPTQTNVHPFPLMTWITAAVFIALYLMTLGVIPNFLPDKFLEYATIYVVVGACIGVWAAFGTFQSLFSGGKGSGGKYLQQSKEVEKLTRQKNALRSELGQTPG